jgi:hypothetical protein
MFTYDFDLFWTPNELFHSLLYIGYFTNNLSYFDPIMSKFGKFEMSMAKNLWFNCWVIVIFLWHIIIEWFVNWVLNSIMSLVLNSWTKIGDVVWHRNLFSFPHCSKLMSKMMWEEECSSNTYLWHKPNGCWSWVCNVDWLGPKINFT